MLTHHECKELYERTVIAGVSFEDFRREIDALTAPMVRALADAVRRPMGVIPHSAERFLKDEDLQAAEARRPLH